MKRLGRPGALDTFAGCHEEQAPLARNETKRLVENPNGLVTAREQDVATLVAKG
ncbi:hypothetical protein GCM10011609_37130 [Lentzea pudingi]|uniref:Uncharacterized protein n=1 Tax=Lentzea pudingi TaxID=1789439 RepID=A0ABQ2I2R4_9PSEU|nr:hypothetical protein GCM10011609_37130 [Lentzea pudingi]